MNVDGDFHTTWVLLIIDIEYNSFVGKGRNHPQSPNSTGKKCQNY